MNLSADQIAELVQGLSNGWELGRQQRTEQRRAPRVRYRGRITIVPHRSGVAETPILVEVTDFSQRGMCISSPTALQAGSQFVARFPSKLNGAIAILCNVVHCRTQSNGYLSIGTEFVCRLQDEQALGPNGLQHTVNDIRQSILD